MNLFVSYDWLKEYVSLGNSRQSTVDSRLRGKGITPEEFAARISLSGPSVEKIMPQGEDLRGVVVGKVLKLGKHPQADKLKLVSVDVGRTGREGRQGPFR